MYFPYRYLEIIVQKETWSGKCLNKQASWIVFSHPSFWLCAALNCPARCSTAGLSPVCFRLVLLEASSPSHTSLPQHIRQCQGPGRCLTRNLVELDFCLSGLTLAMLFLPALSLHLETSLVWPTKRGSANLYPWLFQSPSWEGVLLSTLLIFNGHLCMGTTNVTIYPWPFAYVLLVWLTSLCMSTWTLPTSVGPAALTPTWCGILSAFCEYHL